MTKKPQIVIEIPLLSYDLGLISFKTFAGALEDDLRAASLRVPSGWKFSIKQGLSSQTYESQSDAFENYFGYYLTSPKRVPVAELYFELPYKDKPNDFLLNKIIQWINSSKNLQKLGNRLTEEDDYFEGLDYDSDDPEWNNLGVNAEFFISSKVSFLRSAYGKNRYLGKLCYTDESSSGEKLFNCERRGYEQKLIF